MLTPNPLDVLQGYRLGARRATVELQPTDAAAIHIDFDALRLAEDVAALNGRAVILTGTAGDGKTYLAQRMMIALGLDPQAVGSTLGSGAYDHDGIYIDLDLSSRPLTEARVRRLHAALSAPNVVTLICANEGKLTVLERCFDDLSLAQPSDVLRVNLSRRAIVSHSAWAKVLGGVLDGPIWDAATDLGASPLSWNRAWLREPAVAERVRKYLMLAYLLGEPITVRETLSFLAYALGGGIGSDQADRANDAPIRYLLFNTIFCEPEGYLHGGRATPTEKLLWWLFRFDPGDQASPEMDLRLLVDLEAVADELPDELVAIWRHDLVVRGGEKSDTEYRRRLASYMRYARRWCALATDDGFNAFFPFRHFQAFLDALQSAPEDLADQIPDLIRGLNILLSGGQERDPSDLRVFYLGAGTTRQAVSVYSTSHTIPEEDLRLEPDPAPAAAGEMAGDAYLEQLPRRLRLSYNSGQAVLPISLLLYEVLHSAASPAGGFPATLWAKERSSVARFMDEVGRIRTTGGTKLKFTVLLDGGQARFAMTHSPKKKQLTLS